MNIVDQYSDAPLSIKRLLQRGDIRVIEIGCSSSHVYRLSNADQTFYLKTQSATAEPSFAHEAAILEWLRERLPVPEVLEFFSGTEHEYLVLSEVPGDNCVDAMALLDHGQIARLLAAGLRMIHGVDIADCPFDERIAAKLKNARYNVEHRLVDESDFDPEPLGTMTAQEVLDQLERKRPAEPDLVFNHGDYCLPNILLQNSEISGFIDLSRAGVADRYNDLAIASRSVRYNLGPEFEDLFFEYYELDQVDEDKIAYYRMMDELF